MIIRSSGVSGTFSLLLSTLETDDTMLGFQMSQRDNCKLDMVS
ncbi:hypothetical protein GMORB2_3701 [Geosmithia morbida]|uniref:Uncharacterized protein n=1 Tax=Geosmithia morbida TaxID=1094350 RepID=A0A9P5D3E6_9HYPO|nr:uncharacterized protein GMORB2_3701 [Geosmithia morbida]KAF4124862.1 hypothetical protein GMORB2_3701 [Geosmithia morbida]